MSELGIPLSEAIQPVSVLISVGLTLSDALPIEINFCTETFVLRPSVTFRSLVKQMTTRNLYITVYIYFLDGRLCEVGAVRRGIRIVRR